MAAIYQRARPATFGEVVGQDHVKDVLMAALRRDRAAHAYLFSGPRGVGKTTTARLLAMALNCDADDVGARPCGNCESCSLVRAGRHPDVIELDAASNNSVEDVRELREKTTLSSMRGGMRVWILDEAHMLSRAAANALLKTLEEPPPGLVFVLATTEPEKLPPTVLSRCQHFRFRRLAEDEIRGKLERLCAEAGVEAEAEALGLVARAADGAMRDAESLLERLLTPGAAITRAAAEQALGLPPVERMQRLARGLAEADLEVLLGEAEALYRDGFAPRSLAENLGEVLRQALRADVGLATDVFRLELERPRLLRLIHALDDEQERFVRRDDLYSLEVALIKGLNLASATATADTISADRATPDAVAGPKGASSTPPASEPTAPPAAGRAAAQSRSGAEAGPEAPSAAADGDLPPFEPVGRGVAPRAVTSARRGPAKGGGEEGPPERRLDWHAVRSAAGPQLKAFLMPARENVTGSEITISYQDTHKFHYNEIVKRRGELERLVEQIGGPGYRVRILGPGEADRKKS